MGVLALSTEIPTVVIALGRLGAELADDLGQGPDVPAHLAAGQGHREGVAGPVDRDEGTPAEDAAPVDLAEGGCPPGRKVADGGVTSRGIDRMAEFQNPSVSCAATS